MINKEEETYLTAVEAARYLGLAGSAWQVNHKRNGVIQ